MARTYGKAQDLIDFTRASSGTALRRVKYGAELVTNGTFDTDSDWIKQAGWTISGGTANWDGLSSVYIQQTDVFEPNKTYTITFTISNNTSGTISIRDGVATVLVPNTTYANGTYSFNILSTSNTSLRIYGVGGSGSLSIDNISVKEVTFDTSDGDLILFNHPNNIPRIEYDANGNLLGLLVEESRTNLITYSEDFDNAYWSKTDVTLSTASVKAPDGSYTATKVTASGVSPHMVKQSVASSGDCKSIWARSVSGTGTVSLLANSGSSDNIVTLTEDWQRFDILYDDEINPVPSFFYAVDFRGASTLTEAIIWGAQLEAGSFPTSYIPTSGSTATRSADVASIDVDAFGYRQDEGTVVVEQAISSATKNAVVWQIDDGTHGNRHVLNAFNGNITTVLDWSTVSSLTHSGQDVGVVYKHAFGYKKNDFSSVYDGGTPLTDATGDVPIVDVLRLGKDTGPYAMLNGHIKSIKYLPRRLTNDQLVELTS